MTTWLGVAIGISFTFALFSAVCSSVQELLAWVTELRARTLRNELGRLLGDPSTTALAGAVLKHPLVRNLYRSTRPSNSVGPSYIPTAVFGSALVDLLVGQDVVTAVPDLRNALSDATRFPGPFVAELRRVLALAPPDEKDAATLADAATSAAGTEDGKASLVAVRAEVAKLPDSLLTSLVTALADPAGTTADRGRCAGQIVRFLQGRPPTARLRDALLTQPASRPRDLVLALLDVGSADTRSAAAAQVEAAVGAAGGELQALRAFVAGLPSSGFSVALAAALTDADAAQRKVAQLDLERLAVTAPVDELRHAAALIGGDTGRILAATIDRTVGSLADARARLERWFDDGMDHCSSIYRRRSQLFLMGISAAVVLSVNVDAVRLTKALVNDTSFRDQMVQVAETWSQDHPATPATTNPPATANPPPTPAPTPAAPVNVNAVVHDLRSAQVQIAQLPIPIGWPNDPLWLRWGDAAQPVGAVDVLTKLFGLFISFLALLNGAPFWFSMVNRFVNLRAVGRPPPRSEDQGGASP